MYKIDVVALTGCTRASLGICTSSCGGIAGLVMWKVFDLSLSCLSNHPLYRSQLVIGKIVQTVLVAKEYVSAYTVYVEYYNTDTWTN